MVVNTRLAPGNLRVAVSEEDEEDVIDLGQSTSTWSFHPNPTQGEIQFAFEGVPENEIIHLGLYDMNGRALVRVSGTSSEIQSLFNASFKEVKGGIYLLKMESASKNDQVKLLKL